MAVRNTTEPINFNNVLEDTKQVGIFSNYWQRVLSAIQRALNGLISSRNTGVTGAVATGAVVNHGLNVAPSFVILAPQDGVPTNYYADTITATTFKIHFTGAGSHAFGWSAET